MVCATRSDSFIAHTKVPFITQRTTDLKFRARETKAPGLVFLKKSEITTFTYSKKECGLKGTRNRHCNAQAREAHAFRRKGSYLISDHQLQVQQVLMA